MNNKFTLRDFLVYFSSGTLLIVNLVVVFFNEILSISSEFFKEHELIKEFSGLIIILSVPLIYLAGHLLHGMGFLSLRIYIFIHKKFNKWKIRRFKLVEVIRWLLHLFMYRNRVIYSVITENKNNKTWENPDGFWNDCAILQVKGHFEPANYWYALNDLFEGLYTAFLFSSILSFVVGKNLLGLIFLALMIISHFRAIQFANNFVSTVKRLKKAETTTAQQ